jgi:hypothetical protein
MRRALEALIDTDRHIPAKGLLLIILLPGLDQWAEQQHPSENGIQFQKMSSGRI